MFDVDTFIEDCIKARRDDEPRLAVKELLKAVMSCPSEVAAALPPQRAELVRLHVSPDLTILNVVWAPGMTLGPHDHRMWAAIGIYSGGEDNAFYRRAGTGLVESGGTTLRPRDVCLLGDDAVHAVTNPTGEHAGAIHVYGGDFFTTPRSEWMGEPLEEEPFSVERTLARFEAANAS
jgi:predicted metal-dependent enzyme (double-stranded beta helix superfamily)